MVTIIAGPEKEKFILHKEFACHYSPTFNAGFNSKFLAGETQTYTLDDVAPAPVRLLVHWIYTQTLAVREDKALSADDKEAEDLALIQL